ncbi:hemerythrin domain-containing protein [Solwaraspora sp. WMMD406]|uniref:hemerythrin domain-containing protein n=1 Tax=Solwaraspora sp. WMMD406 TaxID=3016095 RepID=UPI0024159BC9|nr:hemerythrin domain-containing protein [Solwaraspora sp. WMMD406]MDG4766263.1 hemerythrin domain-containing protein [Solwaraspora sp. WMMD406]
MSVGLPPIPSLGDDLDPRHDPGGRDLIDLLTEEHRAIDQLCAELTDVTDPPRRRELSEVLVATVSRHLSGAQQYLYPAVEAALADGAGLVAAAIATDRALRSAIATLDQEGPEHPTEAGPEPVDAVRVEPGAPSAPGAPAPATTAVIEAWHRHRQLVATRLLPSLREAATPEELIRLGNRVEIAEEAAPTRPHLHAPLSPPWNRVVEPALGVVDKVRDVLARRTTYAQDLTPPRGASPTAPGGTAIRGPQRGPAAEE